VQLPSQRWRVIVDKRSLSEAFASLEPEFKLTAADFPMTRLRMSV
jgi:hypothetical protein